MEDNEDAKEMEAAVEEGLNCLFRVQSADLTTNQWNAWPPRLCVLVDRVSHLGTFDDVVLFTLTSSTVQYCIVVLHYSTVV